MPCWLRVVMDDLEQVMLGIFKDHENTFILQNDFDQANDIDVTQLGAQCHLTNSRLRYSGILDLFSFFICTV